MDSREPLGGTRQPQHHHPPPPPPPQRPPGMMMSSQPPVSYNNSGAHSSSPMLNPSAMQNPRFPFNAQDAVGYGDGSSPSSGFRGGERKKRGRPRKYSPSSADGGGNIALGLGPGVANPGPNAGHVDASDDNGTPMSEPSSKKHRGRPPGSGKKQLDALGAAGIGFTPHVIHVKVGEDISYKVMTFSQQGPRTVCIMSANGAVSNVTLRQPAMSGGTVTYEGRYEIISLSGSFLFSDSTSRSRTGALSVSLAGSDGRVMGGVVAGMLVAATPTQIIVGSFIADGKKPKSGPASTPSPNMLNFGGPTAGASPPSEGPSSESSGGSGSSSPMDHQRGQYNNAGQPNQNMMMYGNMGWPNMLSN